MQQEDGWMMSLMNWTWRQDKIMPIIPKAPADSRISGQDFFMPQFTDTRSIAELLIFTNVLALLVALVPLRQLADFSLTYFIAYLFFMNWVTLTYASLVNLSRSWLISVPTWRALLACWLLLIALVGTFSLLGDGLLAYIGVKPWLLVDNFATAIQRMLIGAIMGGLILRYLYVRHQLLVRQRAELASRLQALQARIRPHFLFNSMNTLLELVESSHPHAPEMIENLSSLFRTTLGKQAEVPLQDEIETCQRYLDIEKLRLGERLQVEWQLPDEDTLYDISIPSLTLQPLLENAIYHGVESRQAPSLIRILVDYNGTQVRIVLTNPYQTGNKPRSGNQMALDNIQERLSAYYGASASLVTSQADGVYTVYLAYTLPGGRLAD